MFMDEQRQLLEYLFEIIGEEGWGGSCDEAEIFQDQEGWKMMLEGFTEP